MLSVNLLGHLVDKLDAGVDEEKIDAIKRAPVPTY